MPTPHRRDFLRISVAAASGLSALTNTSAAQNPNDRIVLAIMGLRGRGKEHIHQFSKFDDVEIAYLVDPDENVVPAALKALDRSQKKAPKVEKDIRRVLEDKNVTALTVAAPDHWHALATIWGCQAGKHVYCEKPVSHNIIEGRRMVEAARKHNRIVQAGMQRRSGLHFASAREFLRSGKLGKVPFVQTWIAGNRKSIGHKPDGPVPAGVDYDLWLGPAPERPFNPNRFHYNWHWNWDFGSGEIGNNGIHVIDIARYLLDLDAPTRITSGGGKYFYDDDQQTPDTMVTTFDFPHTALVWEHRIWSPTNLEGDPASITLFGEKGTLIFDKKGWHVRDGVEASDRVHPDQGMERLHFRNFLDCVKSGKLPNGDIEEGHKSTRLCHLGNIAFRVGRVLHFDQKSETLTGDPEANELLGRTCRKPFEVSKI
jgi:predicted dehydrogenase